MISITPLAQENLTSFRLGKKIPLQVRVTVPADGCGDGPPLILVPGKPAPGDINADFGQLTLFVSRDLSAQVGRIQIDFRDEGHDFGFVVDCDYPPFDESDCEGCSGCG
jgi:Fe-S cluster assembly iron-binding protein IscA